MSWFILARNEENYCLVHSGEEIEHVVFKIPASILVSLRLCLLCQSPKPYLEVIGAQGKV